MKTVHSEKGRGTQLNNGARCASGEILIFLHADTLLPHNAFDLIIDFFNDSKNNICRFLLSFDFNNKLLSLYSNFSKYNTQFTRFGDSAVIVRKTYFDKLNGYTNRDTFEDVDFFKSASRFSNIVILNASVISSARRFVLNGVIKQQLLSISLFAAYLFNFNSQLLSKMYNKRKHNTITDSIIIFLRYPKNRQVKTRLAETTSLKFAQTFYKSCAENLIGIVKRIPRVNRFAFYSNKAEEKEIMEWLGAKLFYAPQEGDDLGSRMKNAFEKVFSTGAKKTIIVGTDIPDLSKEIIAIAFNSLNTNDVVIGPSKDGGYYLLGMKKATSQLFEGIQFSTSKVLSETLLKLSELKLTYHLLPELGDIDTEKDLTNWLNDEYENPIKRNIKLAYKPVWKG